MQAYVWRMELRRPQSAPAPVSMEALLQEARQCPPSALDADVRAGVPLPPAA